MRSGRKPPTRCSDYLVERLGNYVLDNGAGSEVEKSTGLSVRAMAQAARGQREIGGARRARRGGRRLSSLSATLCNSV